MISPPVKASDVRYLVDAGPLIGWFSRRDQWHGWSTQALQAVDDVLWTSEAVLAEACYQLGGNTPEVAALVELADSGHLRLLSPLSQATGRLPPCWPSIPGWMCVTRRWSSCRKCTRRRRS